MGTSEVQIRKAIQADAGAIAVVHVASMREAYRTLFPAEAFARIDARDRTERWREHLAGGTSVTMLAEAGGESVGLADFGRCRDEDISPGTVGEVMAIYVHPAAKTTFASTAWPSFGANRFGRPLHGRFGNREAAHLGQDHLGGAGEVIQAPRQAGQLRRTGGQVRSVPAEKDY